MTDQKYILDGHDHVPVDLMTWAKWFGEADRHVGSTHVGEYWISTVFLGMDHGFGLGGPPLLYETMVFKDVPDTSEYGDGVGWRDFDGEMDRYSTWDEAAAGHEAMVEKIKKMREEEA